MKNHYIPKKLVYGLEYVQEDWWLLFCFWRHTISYTTIVRFKYLLDFFYSKWKHWNSMPIYNLVSPSYRFLSVLVSHSNTFKHQVNQYEGNTPHEKFDHLSTTIYYYQIRLTYFRKIIFNIRISFLKCKIGKKWERPDLSRHIHTQKLARCWAALSCLIFWIYQRKM